MHLDALSEDDQQQFILPPVEVFTAQEELVLRHYVTNTDKPVFGLINLPEVVKGALFARYSRSNKSLRRLLLDEFMDDLPSVALPVQEGHKRAETLYERVFHEYGDDSVAQLGSAHLACEGVSNILTKVLERGRLMAYLEQSTRYVPYNGKIAGSWKYHIPGELHGALRTRYCQVLDSAFETYSRLLEPMESYYRVRFPRDDGTPQPAYNRTIRAKALDALRGLLPAATRSNLGIYGSGQAYEMLLLRMRSSAMLETRTYAQLMLQELRKIIPSFVVRIDRADRGVAWSEYLAETEKDTRDCAANLVEGAIDDEVLRADVQLTDFDPDGEVKIVAAALYPTCSLSDDQLFLRVQRMSVDERRSILSAYIGDRKNRRHRPGRAFERTYYRFDVKTDYGAFRDLQRHRMLTLDWQSLSPNLGYVVGEDIEEAGVLDEWKVVMNDSAELYHDLLSQNYLVAQYAISMAYRIRFYMEMNAREAMHVIELRTAPQGHESYRRICQQMHNLIAQKAGHHAIAAAMQFVNHEQIGLERLEAEKATQKRVEKNGP